MDLTDRVALVTGGGSGLGRATTKALARRGANVCLRMSMKGTNKQHGYDDLCRRKRIRRLQGMQIPRVGVVVNALLSVAIVLSAARAQANGWEHAAIPFDALVKALDLEWPETRRTAAESLGFRGQREAVEPLLARLAKPEENPHVRRALYLALGRLGDGRGVTALLVLVWTAQDISFPAATINSWIGMAYLGVISMFLASVFWYRGLAAGGVARIGQLNLLVPLITIIWAAALLGEEITQVSYRAFELRMSQ